MKPNASACQCDSVIIIETKNQFEFGSGKVSFMSYKHCVRIRANLYMNKHMAKMYSNDC